MNLTYDQNDYFNEQRNSEIGKSIAGPINEIPESWRPDIIEVTEKDPNTREYRFNYAKCSWASLVDPTTNLVESWHFISAPEECKALKYYEGPW